MTAKRDPAPFDPECRVCRTSRKIAPGTKNIQRTGLCRRCAAAVATQSRQKPSAKRGAHRDAMKQASKALSPRPWEYAALKRAQAANLAPSSSWWTAGAHDVDRTAFDAALEDQLRRFKAGGSQ